MLRVLSTQRPKMFRCDLSRNEKTRLQINNKLHRQSLLELAMTWNDCLVDSAKLFLNYAFNYANYFNLSDYLAQVIVFEFSFCKQFYSACLLIIISGKLFITAPTASSTRGLHHSASDVLPLAGHFVAHPTTSSTWGLRHPASDMLSLAGHFVAPPTTSSMRCPRTTHGINAFESVGLSTHWA